ncbi:MAG: tetratricopeptide repeat protein, partial [Smithella sp.]
MNRNILKGIICCGALVFIISACATVKNFAGFFRHTDGKKNNEEKLTTFAQAMRPARGNSDAHFLLARYYQERGNHHEAIIEFEKTLAIDPGNVKALNAMGVSCDFLKQ